MEVLPREAITHDGLSILLVCCLALVAIAKYAFPAKFRAFSMLIQNNKFFLGRNIDAPLTSGFNVLLFLVQLVSISIFLYLVIQTLASAAADDTKLMMVRIILLYALFIAVKVLGEKMIAVLFNGERVIGSYHYFKLSYYNVVGILLLPINALLLYTFQESKWTILIVLFIFVGINGIILLKSLLPHSRLISRHPFYFILYLCALEIAPYFIVYKFVALPLDF
ncbi:MAG: DUF4271 domain-containing protein [Leeuwenhoekiella sp.]